MQDYHDLSKVMGGPGPDATAMTFLVQEIASFCSLENKEVVSWAKAMALEESARRHTQISGLV